jgi:hypothetical protein
MSFYSDVHNEQKFGLGKTVRQNGKEFIYLKGVASCAEGSWVTFDEAYQSALLVANGKGRVGIAGSAVVANKFGWFQIYGKAVGNVLALFADNGIPFATSTPGSVDDAVVTGDLVLNAIGRSAVGTPASGQAYFELNYPSVNDTLG